MCLCVVVLMCMRARTHTHAGDRKDGEGRSDGLMEARGFGVARGSLAASRVSLPVARGCIELAFLLLEAV